MLDEDMGERYRYESEGKPCGGFWTSSVQKYVYSDWLRWCARPTSWWHSQHGTRRWILTPHEARVLVIDSVADYERIVEAYPKLHERSGKMVPDWYAISQDCDAVHFTMNARLEVDERFDEKENTHPLIVWCCESTSWFRWCFDSVILGLEDNPERAYALDYTESMVAQRAEFAASFT